MINPIQPTIGIKDTSLDDLKSENKKERFQFFADQFNKSELNSQTSGYGAVSSNSKDKESQGNEFGKEQKPLKPDINVLGEKLQKLLSDTNVALEFKMDEETNKMILRLIDNETKEVIQQFPPELALKIARIISSIEGKGQIANAKV